VKAKSIKALKVSPQTTKALAKNRVTVLPPMTAIWAEAEKIVPRSNFAKLTFWNDLKDTDQERLTSETYKLRNPADRGVAAEVA
jgi:hypothetical protein